MSGQVRRTTPSTRGHGTGVGRAELPASLLDSAADGDAEQRRETEHADDDAPVVGVRVPPDHEQRAG